MDELAWIDTLHLEPHHLIGDPEELPPTNGGWDNP